MTPLKPFQRLVLLAALALPCAVFPAPDAPKSKDHPLLTRYPGSHIAEYEKNYNAVEFAVGQQGGEPQRKAVEGDATVIRYFHGDPQKQPLVRFEAFPVSAARHIGRHIVSFVTFRAGPMGTCPISLGGHT